MVDISKALPDRTCVKSSPHVRAERVVPLHSAASPFRREVVFDPSGYVDGKKVDYLPSRTRQEFADECDINNILRGYEKNGWPPADPSQPPVYLDCTSWSGDFREHCDQMIEASAAFMKLPADARLEFHNDPVEFIAFASDPKHLDQMREWGLAPRPDAPAPPLKVEVVNPSPAAPAASTSS